MLQAFWTAIVPGMRASVIRLFAVLLCLAAASPTLAHTGSVSGGFAGGLSHPLFGLDHVVAMVAVGLWGAFLGAPAIFILPVVFPLVMAFGGVLGILGVPLPGVEIGIAVSATVLGMMVALAARPPLWVAAVDRRRVRDLPRPCPRRRAAARRRRASPIRRASSSRPARCISAASPSACWRAGPWAGSRCGPPAACIAIAGLMFLGRLL